MDYEKLFALRRDVILIGKSSERFAKIGQEKAPKDEYRKKKYFDKTDVDASGSIGENDIRILADIIERVRPTTIFEAGTWFGTSAYCMSDCMKQLGIEGTVYTCDKHDVFVSTDGSDVVYKNAMSYDAMKSFLNHGIRVQFAFIDAGLKEEKDIRRLIELFGKNKIIIALHDWGQKGTRNVNAILKLKPNLKLTVPPMLGLDSTMCLLEEK